MSLDEDTRWLEWVTKQFEAIAGEDKEIDLDEFKTALKVKESFFAERFFALFDSDGSSSISLDELLGALNLLIHGSDTDKLRFLFQVYDVDDELRTVLKSCLRESAISLPEEKLDDLTLALFESADKDNSGSITFEELKAELEEFPEAPRYLTLTYWQNNSRKLLFLCLYACLMLLLFTAAAVQHQQGGAWFMVAKGCGQCLNFNCTFVMRVLPSELELVLPREHLLVFPSRGVPPAATACSASSSASTCYHGAQAGEANHEAQRARDPRRRPPHLHASPPRRPVRVAQTTAATSTTTTISTTTTTHPPPPPPPLPSATLPGPPRHLLRLWVVKVQGGEGRWRGLVGEVCLSRAVTVTHALAEATLVHLAARVP
ncbi:hypothetical protein CRUP_032229 [Coryphaenoides rupestris]|nr:hypothetical protein CRUP_032229 [Coryphaenoides rupestris]